MGVFDLLRLMRAGYVLAREGAFSLVEAERLPPSARTAVSLLRLIERRAVRRTGRVERLTRALTRLGPTYVKFGQLLATRPDIVGAGIAEDLSALQDQMPPFDGTLVPGLLQKALGDSAKALGDISAPIAAASIAQVHKAELTHEDGTREQVAVKVLRPRIGERFRRDLKSLYAGARLAEFLVPPLRRLKPVSVIATLERSARMELDLRFEAAAISEFGENTKDDSGFALPDVRWPQVAETVLTTSWVSGVPIRDNAGLDAAGVERKALAAHLIQSFLRHAIRDGFFHADMHPGNLFADPQTQGIIAVDFGIMGRIGPKERRFLADVLYGFITRDYPGMARRHFEIGYVPAEQSVDDFALALRAIGEPLHGQLSRDISMAGVLGQLLAVTELFNMQTRPELLLLQKNMVLVEGVARALDEELDIWTVSRPVVEGWLRDQVGPRGQIDRLKAHSETLVSTLQQIPDLIQRGNRLLGEMEAERAEAEARQKRWMRLWFLLAVVGLFLVLWRIG